MNQCKYMVIDSHDRYALRPRTCNRKATRGAYCSQHAAKVEYLNALNAQYGQSPFDPHHKPEEPAHVPK